MQQYELDSRFRIEHDGTSFVLAMKSTKEKAGRKGDGWYPVGYYPRLPALLWTYISRSVGASPETLPEALTEAVRAVQKASDELSGAINRACGGAL